MNELETTPLNIDVGSKALVTFDNWFLAPNGQQYKAAFGTVKAVRTAEHSLGFNPGPRSATWYLELGRLTIAGCQVHYAVRSETCSFDRATDYSAGKDGGITEYTRPSHIYDAD